MEVGGDVFVTVKDFKKPHAKVIFNCLVAFKGFSAELVVT